MSPRLPRLAAAVALVASLATPAAAGAAPTKYISIGDSYAAGYQLVEGRAVYTRNGFAYQLRTRARTRGYRGLRLVNFACGGETTTSILTRTAACRGLGPGGVRYAGRTQATAAERYLRRNRGDVAFVTVSIGGNDVTACAAPGVDALACANTAAQRIRSNVGTLVRRLRRAVGRGVPIVGITYPDVLLGAWVTGRKEDQDLARLSVAGFRSIFNPALKQTYERLGARFVDVTQATGAYTPLEQTTTLAPYGVVPVAVAEICRISYYCESRDIHLKTVGYRRLADLIAARLPRARRR